MDGPAYLFLYVGIAVVILIAVIVGFIRPGRRKPAAPSKAAPTEAPAKPEAPPEPEAKPAPPKPTEPKAAPPAPPAAA
ncbi:MAG TPA: hypothetical protein VM841_08580, partial [Actinomycetota bacterium]|nr:hypothetical protein [Actinomycetota bacterium]